VITSPIIKKKTNIDIAPMIEAVNTFLFILFTGDSIIRKKIEKNVNRIILYMTGILDAIIGNIRKNININATNIKIPVTSLSLSI
jgi:CRISPR/Cas system endoribonuclease Cas6 (RAMP superfamily)